MTSTLSRMRSAASSGSLSMLNAAYRCSMTMVWPSTQPRVRNSCRNGDCCRVASEGSGSCEITPDPSDLARLLPLDDERRKPQADRENDREPDPPHVHLGAGWLAGVRPNHGRLVGSSARLMNGHTRRSATSRPPLMPPVSPARGPYSASTSPHNLVCTLRAS
jgi:hypothetical protein